MRGHRGTIVADHGEFDSQDTDAHGYTLPNRPQHVYTVSFTARELWGETANARDTVTPNCGRTISSAPDIEDRTVETAPLMDQVLNIGSSPSQSPHRTTSSRTRARPSRTKRSDSAAP